MAALALLGAGSAHENQHMKVPALQSKSSTRSPSMCLGVTLRKNSRLLLTLGEKSTTRSTLLLDRNTDTQVQ